MDLKEVNLFLHHLEDCYPINQWKVDNIYIWPLIRISVGDTLNFMVENMKLNPKDIPGTTEQLGNYVRKIWSFICGQLKLAIFDFKHRQELQSADVLVFGEAVGRNICLPQGELMDHLIDPLQYELKQNGVRVVKFEKCEDIYRYPRFEKSYIVDDFIIKSWVKSKLMDRICHEPQINSKSYALLLEECFEIGVPIERIKFRRIMWLVKYIECLAKEFISRLMIIKPKVIIYACWYSVTQMALALAGHRLGIPVVEVQHGMAGGSDSHFAYYDWCQMPADGYELMPDYMWVWDQETYDSVARWGERKVIPILGGYPTYLFWGNPNNQLSRYFKTEFKKKYYKKQPVILFTLQWGTVYPDWIVDFINTEDEYTWLIRLHPVVDKGEQEFLRKLEKKENIVWEGVNAFPLDYLLQSVSLHITMHSSVVIEGDVVDCPSVVLHPLATHFYSSQMIKGIARYADGPEKLSLVIKEILLQDRKRINSELRERELYLKGKQGVNELLEIVGFHEG